MDKPDFWMQSGELPGILNWALAGLHDLRQAGGFVLPQTSRDMLDRLRVESNPARRFLQENYEAGPDTILTAELYREYTAWCQENGHHRLAEVGFGKELARCFKQVRRVRGSVTFEGKRPWEYRELRRKSE
jgi:phage/plasmid-associated DNA primase